MCMARALLRNSNIVEMEEGTASVDITTESPTASVNLTIAFVIIFS